MIISMESEIGEPSSNSDLVLCTYFHTTILGKRHKSIASYGYTSSAIVIGTESQINGLTSNYFLICCIHFHTITFGKA